MIIQIILKIDIYPDDRNEQLGNIILDDENKYLWNEILEDLVNTHLNNESDLLLDFIFLFVNILLK